MTTLPCYCGETSPRNCPRHHSPETPEPDEYDTDTASNMADLAGPTIPAPDGYDGLPAAVAMLRRHIKYDTGPHAPLRHALVTVETALARLLREHEALKGEREAADQHVVIANNTIPVLFACSLPLPEDSTDGR